MIIALFKEESREYDYRDVKQLLLRIKLSQRFSCKHLIIYSHEVASTAIPKDIYSLSQQLAFVKITKNVIKQYPELKPYLNQIFLASYVGILITELTHPGYCIEWIEFNEPTKQTQNAIDFEW